MSGFRNGGGKKPTRGTLRHNPHDLSEKRQEKIKDAKRHSSRSFSSLSHQERYVKGRALATETTLQYSPKYTLDRPDETVRPVRDEMFDDLVRIDYADMMRNGDIAVTNRVKRLLLMQSIVGHAQSGHRMFEGQAVYPNATIEDVYGALGVDPDATRKERQGIIDGTQSFLETALRDPYDSRLTLLVDRKNMPLAGAKMFMSEKIDPKKGDLIHFLRGFYLASCMDNYEWRERVQKRFGIIMGGGKNVALDMMVLTANGQSLNSLSTEEHDEEFIKNFTDIGAILSGRRIRAGDNITNGYVRIKRGKGVSDDGAIVTAGLKYGGFPAMCGGFSCDSVDTWDKSTPFIYTSGQDELLGQYVWEECHRRGIDLGLDEQKVEEFIYLSSINPEKQTQYPDCSQRRFLMMQDGVFSKKRTEPYYALRLHKEFVEAKLNDAPLHLPLLRLGFAQVSSSEFQKVYMERFEEAHDQGIIATPRKWAA